MQHTWSISVSRVDKDTGEVAADTSMNTRSPKVERRSMKQLVEAEEVEGKAKIEPA